MDYKNELNSDDDFDCSNGYNESYSNNNSGYITNGTGRTPNPNGLSKAELRKTNKPIMEKRRRARINHCLNELKSLILEAMKKDPARHTKLEKADILEMTVKYLQSLQRQQLNLAIQTDPSVIHKYKTGFVECAEEVNRYIAQSDSVDVATRQRLKNHLNNCATSLEQIGSMTNFSNGYRHGAGAANNIFAATMTNPLVTTAVTSGHTTAALFPTLPQDLNNNNRSTTATTTGGASVGINAMSTATAIQMNGVQLIPSRLPSGELALIVPNAHAATAAASLLGSNNNNVSNLAAFPAWPTPTTATATAATTAASLPLLDNAAALPAINNFAAQLQRMSAFSKPAPQMASQVKTSSNIIGNKQQLPITASNTTLVKPHFHTTTAAAFHQPLPQNSTTTTSPPLSPISSVSSLSAGAADDSSSLMHTSSDLLPTHDATSPATNNAGSAISEQHSFSGVFATPPLSTESSLCLSSSTSTGSSLSMSLSRGSKHLQQQQVSSTSGCESLNGSRKRTLQLTEGSDDFSDGSLDESSSKRFATEAVETEVPATLVSRESKVAETASSECKKQQLQILNEDRESMWRPW